MTRSRIWGGIMLRAMSYRDELQAALGEAHSAERAWVDALFEWKRAVIKGEPAKVLRAHADAQRQAHESEQQARRRLLALLDRVGSE